MEMQARVLWDALVSRTPVMLRIVEGLSDEQLRWLPPNGVNSIAWLLWHIAEVEDNWIRGKLLHVPKRLSVRRFCQSDAATSAPSKGDARYLLPRGTRSRSNDSKARRTRGW